MTNAVGSIEARERRRVDHAAFYRMIWRWHFYAGLFCLPFVTILALSGSVYLFKPQIDAYFDRPYTHMTLSGAPRSLDDQVETALAAVPDSRIKGLELREDTTDAARVSVMDETGREQRVLVRPDTLEILAVQDEKWRLSSFMHDIHGSMLLGKPGAIMLELAGAWAIVMIITGLYMWWPRGGGLAGLLYPRDGRPFLRDLHAVTGFYVSFFALFLLVSGLPWTVVWGEGFKMARDAPSQPQQQVDWTTGPASEKAQRMAEYNSAPRAADEHAEHRDHAGMKHDAASKRLEGFDRVAQLARPEHLAAPVILTPPSPKNPNWQVRSATQNRPQQKTLSFDPTSFALVNREDFSGKAMIDKVVGVGIAAHEGHLFGVANQLLGLFTALSFLALVVSSLLMWLRRRQAGALGAPPALAEPPRLAPALVLLILLIGLFLPTLGVSLVAVFCFEAAAKRFTPGIAAWLGLTPRAARLNSRDGL
ncbi:PepSY-associated TM helix domain-containing protein [Methylocystis parvus]|uniref:PepSY domain-containing protein n=1 Tax=Methylocystis parvus TaxID=134 RepID=A0A6B8MBJ6_9HYPH|nr:PepSY domain-containing protein [Methylocystis parvus]QGN00112.1 PepSY domain-containing protein [Methylocystis parvus]WBK02389.1 PepSY domain-containing protein [Methylocystis parvus OBBP]